MKKLFELTAEERARLYPIILTEYNPEWANWYKDEKARIEKLIGRENIVSIRHIGSTSVPGLTAKPTVDILLEIVPQADLVKLKENFPFPEYVCLDSQTIPTNDIILFIKGYTPQGFADRVYHIHVRYEGDWDEVYFRDYLIAQPDTAAEYTALKAELSNKFEYDRDGYTNAKAEFIMAITKKAREELKMDLSKIGIRVLVKDFAKCFDFYKDVLGLEPTWGDRDGVFASFGKGQDVYFSMFAESNMSMYQGYVRTSGTGAADKAVFCIPSKDIDADYASLKAKGVEFIGEPQTIQAWFMRCVYFRDPEGNLFEISQ